MSEPPRPQPNRKLQAAREALSSPSGAPGLPMSRRELADAANAYVWHHTNSKQHTNMTEHDIGRYERGEVRWPGRWRRLGLRGALKVTTDKDLGFYRNRYVSVRDDASTSLLAGVAPAPVSEGPKRPKATLDTPHWTLLNGIATVAATCGLFAEHDRDRRIGVSDVDRLNAITALYRSVDYERGGGLLYAEVNKFADAASALLEQPYAESLAPRLLAGVAAVRQLAGWTAFDAWRHADAQRHLLAAERAAVAAGDVLLAARVRYCQARQYQHLRHNRDALDTLRLAREHIGSKSTAAVSAMINGAEAASLAALGDGKQALALLGRAEDSFSMINLEQEPSRMNFYDHGELLAQYGRVYRDLARGDRRFSSAAVRSTTEAVDELNPQNARSSVLNKVGLCSALFLAGHPEQAAEVGFRAVEQARGLSSPRVNDRLHNVQRDLAPYRTVPEVARLAHTLAAIGPRTAR